MIFAWHSQWTAGGSHMKQLLGQGTHRKCQYTTGHARESFVLNLCVCVLEFEVVLESFVVVEHFNGYSFTPRHLFKYKFEVHRELSLPSRGFNQNKKNLELGGEGDVTKCNNTTAMLTKHGRCEWAWGGSSVIRGPLCKDDNLSSQSQHPCKMLSMAVQACNQPFRVW